MARARYRGHNIGGKGESHTQTAGSHNRPYSLGLRAQKVTTHMRAKVRRRH